MFINKETILLLGKRIYKKLPVDVRKKQILKDSFYTWFGFVFKNTMRYKAWCFAKEGHTAKHTVLRPDKINIFTMDELCDDAPGKIAIHMHLYYIDLLDEFAGYARNMPFSFDLYVSIADGGSKTKVTETFKNIGNIKKLKVVTVPNRGRDVAPFAVTFARDLAEYDYICHCHTKKSLYTGTEQDTWRKHLMCNLLGSEANIRKIFAIFKKHEDVGLVYPVTYHLLPYSAHTWLSNKEAARIFLNSMGISPGHISYIDFPAGTMFWARAKALKKLLSLGLTYHDFAEERGQNDGTIAHVIERALVPIVKSQEFTLAEADVENNLYVKGRGQKNLWQYWGKKDGDVHIIDGYDLVSFDIFDTLVTRRILEPDFAFKLVEHKITHRLGRQLDFAAERNFAELEARRKANFTGDCSIDDIYTEFRHLTGLDKEICEQIKALEIETEWELCIPRKDVVAFFDYAKAKGKRILLMTDMYLRRPDIEGILAKCGIAGYDDLWISSEKRKRKDTGEIWTLYMEQHASLRCLHIGDNEHSDVQHPGDRQIANYHVMSGVNLFTGTNFGGHIYNRFRADMQWGDAALLGTIVAKEFNSPFALSGTQGRYQIRNLHSLGYVVFGPLILYFMRWLIKHILQDKRDGVLFFAREGYLLEKLYHKAVLYLKQAAPQGQYFLCSRRAVSVAGISSEADIADIVKQFYKGKIADLLNFRFGLQTNPADPRFAEQILLPRDYEKVQDILREYMSVILANAQKERTAYLQYCAANDILKYNNPAIVDIGYAGTIQYYLAKLLDKPVHGYYFVTNIEQKALQYKGNSMRGCYGEQEDGYVTEKIIFKYHLILESVLTSPDGQLECFTAHTDGITPVYGQSGYAQRHFSSIAQIHAGISAYFDDMLDAYKENVFEMPVTEQLLHDILGFTVWDKSFLAPEIANLFSVEDNYCSSDEISAYAWYRNLDGVTEEET
jgi:predicted HAD superfamily hydrolase